MRILYVFPHPDDESYGPGLAIARQRRENHEVHLLTLTKGGATKQRHKFGYTVEQMGEVRYKEMRNVARELDLSSMTVLDLPDSELKELCPEEIERHIKDHIERLDPDIVITYALHGISGYDDHLVMHAAVKSVFCDLRRDGASRPRRLAFFCIREDARHDDEAHGLRPSREQDIDCAYEIADEDFATARRALACYETYKDKIGEEDPLGRMGRTIYFEIFGEDHTPPLADLTNDL